VNAGSRKRNSRPGNSAGTTSMFGLISLVQERKIALLPPA
jgi:hypothetical protein